jgi:hypothetical protein
MLLLKPPPNDIFNCYIYHQLWNFLSLQCSNFSKLILHVLGLKFGYVSTHAIPDNLTNPHVLMSSQTMLRNFEMLMLLISHLNLFELF